MDKRRIAVLSLLGYLLTMLLGVLMGDIILGILGKSIVKTMTLDSSNIIYKIIIQIPPTAFILYFSKKYYTSEEIGFSKMNKQNIIWFLPYLIVLICMSFKFISQLINKVKIYDVNTIMFLIIAFIGTVMAGFCEEVIFRGIVLNSFKRGKSFIGAMIISSIGFSIVHISTVFMGNPIINALATVFYSSLLGFAFVGLVMKIKNIWPLIIFHILWNFILMISQTLNLELSLAVGICNVLNIFMAIILWIIVIIEENKSKKLYS